MAVINEEPNEVSRIVDIDDDLEQKVIQSDLTQQCFKKPIFYGNNNEDADNNIKNNNINNNDKDKPFSFGHKDDTKHETFSNDTPINFGSDNWTSVFKQNNTDTIIDNNTDSSWNDINWSFSDNQQQEQKKAQEVEVVVEEDNCLKNTFSFNFGNNEYTDNGIKNAFSQQEQKEEEEKKTNYKSLITDTIDDVNDKLYFKHRIVRAWRWDDEQNKWRGRGKGQLFLYWNEKNGIARIIFIDEKHKKTRLLQYIDGDTLCKYIVDDNCVEWHGADYTMDNSGHMVANWAVRFMENQIAAKQFMDIFNNYITGNINVLFAMENINNDDNAVFVVNEELHEVTWIIDGDLLVKCKDAKNGEEYTSEHSCYN